jgi:hypothetical protein
MHRPDEVLKATGEVYEGIFGDDAEFSSGIPLEASNRFYLKIFLKTSENTIVALLGKVGKNLRKFLDKADLEHPEMSKVFGGAFATSIPETIVEFIHLFEFAEKNGYNNSPPMIAKAARRFLTSAFKEVGDPSENQQSPRLIKDPDVRSSIRHTKNMRAIELSLRNQWHSLPSSFRLYACNNNGKEEEVKKAQRKADRYKKLGCSDLEGEILLSIEKFITKESEIYFGFHRITMTNVAIILAKIHGYKLMHTGGKVFLGQKSDKLQEIVVPDFNGYDFVPSFMEDIKPPSWTFEYRYCPHAYPAHLLMDIASDSSKRILEYVDNFPHLGNRPLFDHYIVVVPGVENPIDSKSVDDLFSFVSKNGKIKYFSDNLDLQKDLDLELIRYKYISPVLLGEREGKCYFLCYFT